MEDSESARIGSPRRGSVAPRGSRRLVLRVASPPAPASRASPASATSAAPSPATSTTTSASRGAVRGARRGSSASDGFEGSSAPAVSADSALLPLPRLSSGVDRAAADNFRAYMLARRSAALRGRSARARVASNRSILLPTAAAAPSAGADVGAGALSGTGTSSAATAASTFGGRLAAFAASTGQDVTSLLVEAALQPSTLADYTRAP